MAQRGRGMQCPLGRRPRVLPRPRRRTHVSPALLVVIAVFAAPWLSAGFRNWMTRVAVQPIGETRPAHERLDCFKCHGGDLEGIRRQIPGAAEAARGAMND